MPRRLGGPTNRPIRRPPRRASRRALPDGLGGEDRPPDQDRGRDHGRRRPPARGALRRLRRAEVARRHGRPGGGGIRHDRRTTRRCRWDGTRRYHGRGTDRPPGVGGRGGRFSGHRGCWSRTESGSGAAWTLAMLPRSPAPAVPRDDRPRSPPGAPRRSGSARRKAAPARLQSPTHNDVNTGSRIGARPATMAVRRPARGILPPAVRRSWLLRGVGSNGTGHGRARTRPAVTASAGPHPAIAEHDLYAGSRRELSQAGPA